MLGHLLLNIISLNQIALSRTHDGQRERRFPNIRFTCLLLLSDEINKTSTANTNLGLI
jgi:hypothetical protein